jgi:hypothetical protein
MYGANIPDELQTKLWREAFKTATLLDELVMITVNCEDKPRYKHWCGMMSKFTHHLRVWGETGTVKLKTATTPKIDDCGKVCMFVGYALNQAGDCYQM